MDALVIAGGTPGPEDPLFPYTRGQAKSMVDVAGKPMVQWVLDALSGASAVDRVVVSGLSADAGVTCAKPSTFIPDQGTMLDNIKAGLRRVLEFDPAARHALVVSSDIPGITSAMVDWRAQRVAEAGGDLDYAVIERSVMEKRYPGSKRSYTRLKDAEVCGGDLNAVRPALATDEGVWERLIAARKNALKQAALLGFDILALLLMGRLSLADAEVKVSKRLGINGKVCLSPYAEIGMDVDKPHQLEIMRQDLVSRSAQPA